MKHQRLVQEISTFERRNGRDQIPDDEKQVHSEKRPIWILIACLLGLLLTSPLVAQGLRLRVLSATGTAEEIRAALQKSADFNDRDWTGVTALMAAAGYNHNANVVPVLLQYGAVVDARDINGETALMFAAERSSDPAVITALLSGGAGLETTDRLGRTALIYAAKYNSSLEVLTALLKAGARVNARDAYGMSALLYAAWVGQNPSIVLALISAGADLKAQGMAGRTLVQYAQDNPILMKDAQVFRQLQGAMNEGSKCGTDSGEGMMNVDTNKIGGFLVSIGVMQPWQLEDILLAQRSGDTRMFGEIAIDLGYIEDAALQLYVDSHSVVIAARV